MTAVRALPPVQRSCLWLASALLAFAVYGSLIPFAFVPRPVGDAAAAFAEGLRWVGRSPAADVLSNVLLFLPLGYFAAGAGCADGAGWRCRVRAAARVVAGLALCAAGLEFAQTWFPDRTVSLDDVLALTAGAALGAAGWLAAGPATMSWLWRHLQRRAPASPAVKLLAVYAAFFALASLAPLDLTIDPAQLRAKFDEGRMVLWPLARLGPWPGVRLLTWAAAAAPLGLLGLFGWTRLGQARHPAAAAIIGLGLLWSLAAVQAFVYSHRSNVNEALAGTIGILTAVAAAAAVRAARPMLTGGARP